MVEQQELNLERLHTSPKDILKKMKLTNANKIIIGHLNINSIRNKIEDLKYLIAENIDILLISETKLNNTFPESQFLISGFQPPYWEDRNEKGGGLLLYVREHIPSKKLNINFYPKIEAFAIEIKLKKKKWFRISSYNPHKSMIVMHLNSVSKQLDALYKKYENILIIGDLNSEISEDVLCEFCCVYNLKNLVKNPTCFKNIDRPSCIDFILTNKSGSFQNTLVIETGLSYFHRLSYSYEG